MTNLKTVLTDYGADYESLMARFMGNEPLYLRKLAMLPRDESLQHLGKALHAGDYPSAFNAAHTLKGVALNLGLVPLEQASCSIVEPLRRLEPRGDYPVLYQSIEKEFERAADLLEQLKEVE